MAALHPYSHLYIGTVPIHIEFERSANIQNIQVAHCLNIQYKESTIKLNFIAIPWHTAGLTPIPSVFQSVPTINQRPLISKRFIQRT